MPEIARILVMSPNWLGDAVMALPAIADVRRAFPSARLIVAARRSVAGIFQFAPVVDEVIQAERHAIAAADAGAVLILPNSFASALLARRAGVPERWGYATDWRRPLLTRAVPQPGGSMHQGAYYQALTHALGIERGPLQPALTVSAAAMDEARSLLRSAGWDGSSPLIALAPGAAYGTAKRWLPAHVARLIDGLAAEATCVMLGGPADASTTRQVSALVSSGAATRLIDLAGRTSLTQMAAVLALAQACVSNDSGAMHVAAALGTPVAAIFGPTRERETAPLTRAGGRAEVVLHAVWCRPCMLRECPLDHRCMKGVTPDMVRAALQRLTA
jgi:heptosyltransferase-2